MPTLPLPQQEERPVRGWWNPPGRSLAIALLVVAGAFAGGWALGEVEPRRVVPRQRVEAASPPTADARFCGRALDVSARLAQIYREALENRVSAADAALGDDLALMRRLDGQLAGLTAAADHLEARVTRALAICPS